MNTTPAPTFDTADIDGVLETAAEAENIYGFRELDGNDRCDADSAEQATSQVLIAGEVLLFCSHHYRKNADVLNTYPHSVPDEASQPMTFRRAAELGAPVSRAQGDEHA